jgi:hypothetical protein
MPVAEVDKKIIVHKIEEITKQKGFIYSLAIILLQSFFYDPEEAADIDWRSKLSFQEISFLVGLMVKNHISLELPTEESCRSHIEGVSQLFQDLHEFYTKPFKDHMLSLSRKVTTSKDDVQISENILSSGTALSEAIFYGDSGAYDFQLWDFAIKRYEKDKEWLRNTKGINIATAVAICRKLKELAVSKSIKVFNAKNFNDFAEAALAVFCFSENDLSEFGSDELKNILKAFSVLPATKNQTLSTPGEYNVIISNPIIILRNGVYFIPILFNFAQSIYESPFYWMIKDEAYKEKSLINRGQSTVKIARELLANVFGEANVIEQVVIARQRGQAVTDIDLLAVTGNKAVAVQIKSKKLTSIARTGDEKQLRADFNAAIQDAYDQGRLSRNAILKEKVKLIRPGGSEVVLSDAINDVYIICVTSDHYPAVMYQTKTFLKKDESDPCPIVISIFDLEILTYYLKCPFEFLYYLSQRILLNEHFMGQSEIDLLAYHLNQKLFPLKDEKSGRPIDWALIDGMGQLIDAHFPSARGYAPKTNAMQKLHAKWSNPDFQEMVDQLKKSKQPGFTDAIFYLFDLAGKGADQFISEVKALKERCLRERKSLRFHMATNQGDSGICYVCDYENHDKLFRHLTEYCMVKKYQMKANLWLGFAAMANSSKNFELVMFGNGPWVYDSQLEQIAKKYYTKSAPINLKTREKIGRNDPCPCGSGKKYKKCHGAF